MSQATGQSQATLWIVATPIGHLGDLSERARDLLETVPVIAAEDTRISRRLLARRRTGPRWIRLNEHSEERVVDEVLGLLRSGVDVALVSDAGTPLVSDPGYRLVSAAHAAGLPVSPIPGPCAAIAALSTSGLPSDRFWFEGFLPARASARRRRLQALAAMPASIICYVPARDLIEVLADCIAVLGADRAATVARELTKRHETIRRGRLDELHAFCQNDPEQGRGESVLILAGSERAPATIDAAALAAELALELPPSRAARVLSKLSGLSRKEAWAVIERHRSEAPGVSTLTRSD